MSHSNAWSDFNDIFPSIDMLMHTHHTQCHLLHDIVCELCAKIVSMHLFCLDCTCVRMCVCYVIASLLLMVAIRSHRDALKSFQQTLGCLTHFFLFGTADVRVKIRPKWILCSASCIFCGRNSRLAKYSFATHTHTLADVFATTGHQTAQMTLKYPRILQHSADSQAHTHTLVFIAFSNIWSWYCLLDNAIITSRKLSTETIIGIHISKVGIPAFTYLKILLAWHGTKIPFQCEPLWLDRCKQSLIYACCRHL